MADYLDAAKATIDAQKLALLQTIAQQGQKGRQDYEAGQAAIKDQQKAAVQAALQRAAQLGAPASASQGITDKVTAPSSLQLTNLSGAADSRAANFNSARQAAGTYMTEESAAIPALREITNRKVAELRAAAEERAQQRAFAQQEHEWRMQEHQAALDAAKAKELTPEQIVNKLGGMKFFGERAHDTLEANSMRPGLSMDPQGGSMHSSEIDDALGLPSGYTDFAITSQQPKDKPLNDEALRQTPAYTAASHAFLNAYDLYNDPHGKNKPPSVAAILNQVAQEYGPDIARLVARDFGSPSSNL